MLPRILRSRVRVWWAGRLSRLAYRLKRRADRIVDGEERRWGLASPRPSWRVPNTP